MNRSAILAILLLAMASCQTGSQNAPPPDARKYDHGDKDRHSDTRGSGRWYLQPPSDY